MQSSRHRWILAGLGAVVVHVLLLLGARWEPAIVAEAAASTPPMQLVFAAPRAAEEAKQYVEQPQSPSAGQSTDARYLSNVDAAAADRDAGSGASDPSQHGDAEFPSVPMRAGGISGDAQQLRSSADASAELLRGEAGKAREATPRLTAQTGEGTELFDQPEAARLGSGVELFGDVRLSTVAWDYAPWLQRFRAALIRNWQAPYAFHLGLIHGQQRISVEVGKDGALLGLTLLSNEGHESLQTASLSAFRAAAPYAPLPQHFPEERLVMHWTLIYPEARR